jgi:beta-glucosidase
VVQLYIRDLVASVSRPVKELKGFEKISLEPGEAEKVSFTLTKEDLHYYGTSRHWGVDPGTIRLWVGPDATQGLEASFEIESH